MALISAALGGLGAPAWLWIAILAVGIVVGALAGLSWWAERGRNAADKGSVADSAETRPLTYADLAAIRVPMDDPNSLERQIDDLIRKGRELVAELSAPVRPEKTAGGAWKIEGGGPSAEQQEKADAFRQRAEKLLEKRNPALLADYRDGCNNYIRRPHDEIEARNPSADKRSDGEKMLALANAERRTAAWEVEVCLEGLARARNAI